jgi:hypothetical protein
MVQHIAELNRVLVTAHQLSVANAGIEISTLIHHCKSITIEGRIPDHSITINFSLQIGLLRPIGKKKIQISSEGYNFLEFNPQGIYDLTIEQKNYLIRSFFLDGNFRKEVRQCLKCFVPSEKKGTYTWSIVDGIPFGKNEWIVSHMEQLGLLELDPEGYAVQKTYLETVKTFINEPKGFTEEDLMKWLEEKKKLGNFAEELVLVFEKKRLLELGHHVESRCVRIVGKLKTNAGYDIESFDGKSKDMSFDRLIEVKGSGDPKLRFIWSQNEMKIAKELKERYWIYFQGGIDKKTGKSKFKPILLQDPYHKIPLDMAFTRTEHGCVIESTMRGELLK